MHACLQFQNGDPCIMHIRIVVFILNPKCGFFKNKFSSSIRRRMSSYHSSKYFTSSFVPSGSHAMSLPVDSVLTAAVELDGEYSGI